MFDDMFKVNKKSYKIIECRIFDIFKQSLMSSLTSSPKSFLYHQL